jgi:hypothetical protein
VLQIDAYENKLESEAHIVEAILADAQLAGAGVTADALHCRKKFFGDGCGSVDDLRMAL